VWTCSLLVPAFLAQQIFEIISLVVIGKRNHFFYWFLLNGYFFSSRIWFCGWERITLWYLLQACVKRIQGDESGHKHCTGQYFDYWSCVDKCVSSLSPFQSSSRFWFGSSTEFGIFKCRLHQSCLRNWSSRDVSGHLRFLPNPSKCQILCLFHSFGATSFHFDQQTFFEIE